MNELEKYASVAQAADHEEMQLASVTEQIHEFDAAIDADERMIEVHQDAIRNLRKATKANRATRSVLRAKQRIFANAAHRLRQVDLS